MRKYVPLTNFLNHLLSVLSIQSFLCLSDHRSNFGHSIGILSFIDMQWIFFNCLSSYTLQILFVNQVTRYYIVCSLTSRSIPVKSFTMSVRHIHTQAQALAELERKRAAQRTSYA